MTLDPLALPLDRKKRLMTSKTKVLTNYVLLVVLLSLALLAVLSACQSTPMPQVNPTETAIPTKPAPTSTPTSLPSPTPTLAPVKVSVDPVLPTELQATIKLPSGTVAVENKKEADIAIEAVSNIFEYAYQDSWVYVLAAPFFTVEDDISLGEMRTRLTDPFEEGKNQAPTIKVLSSDVSTIQYLLKLKNPKSSFHITDEPQPVPLEGT